jgi:ABC-type protease/lipase transport system fused ATPase/permease subunit
VQFTDLDAAGSSALSTAHQPSSQLIFRDLLHGYLGRLSHVLKQDAMDRIFNLAEHLWQAWHKGRTVYLFGNGGSADNACHIANEFIYGAGVHAGAGVRVEALSANSAVLTRLANDLGYKQIYLKDDTLAANISFGVDAQDFNQADIESAAKIANLYDFTLNELPQQYQTTVGERGVRLSGGQRQRVAIARAL